MPDDVLILHSTVVVSDYFIISGKESPNNHSYVIIDLVMFFLPINDMFFFVSETGLVCLFG